MGHWESAGLPDDFDGVVRLFPLPNIVLFPHVVQALHIFEPRYCDMLSEALESDHLITMALLLPGWEDDVNGKPAIGETVCVGRIVSHTPTHDGKHNILLAGLKRARIVEELDTNTPFRQARVELLEDSESDLTDYETELYRENLLKIFRSFMPQEASESKSFGELLTRQLPLGVLIDIVSYAANLPSQTKLSILGADDVVARYDLLMDHLGSPELETLDLASPNSGSKDNQDAPPNSFPSKSKPRQSNRLPKLDEESRTENGDDDSAADDSVNVTGPKASETHLKGTVGDELPSIPPSTHTKTSHPRFPPPFSDN